MIPLFKIIINKGKLLFKKAYLFIFILFFILVCLVTSHPSGIILLTLLFLYLTIKLPVKIPLILGIIFLAFLPLFLILKQEELASQIAIYGYIFLVVGIATILERILFKRDPRLLLSTLQTQIYKPLTAFSARLSRYFNILFNLKISPRFSLNLFSRHYLASTSSLSDVNLFLILIIVLFAFSPIIFRPGMPLSGDLVFPLNTQEYSLPTLFSSWNDIKSYPAIREIGAQKIIFLLPISVLVTVFSLSIETVSRLLLFGGILIAGWGSYLGALIIFRKSFPQNKNISLFALLVSIFYMFNPWSMARIVHYFHWIAYAFTPLIFINFVLLLETKKKIYLFFTPFLLALISFSPHFIVYNLIALSLYLVIDLIFNIKKNIGTRSVLPRSCAMFSRNLSVSGGRPYLFSKDRGLPVFLLGGEYFPSDPPLLYRNFNKKFRYKKLYKDTFKKIGLCFLALILFLTFSSYWLLPFLFISLQEEEILTPSYTLRQFDLKEAHNKISPLNIITLNLNAPKKSLIWRLICVGILITIVFNFVLNRKLKFALFFSILAVPLIVISSLSLLLPPLHSYFVLSLPFGWLFREIAKIGGILAFAYAFVFGFILIRIFSIISLPKSRRWQAISKLFS